MSFEKDYFMRFMLLIPGVCLIFFSCMASNVTIPANDPKIEYTGRINFSNPLAPKFSYSGVSIRASFKGTNISATFDDEFGKNYYNIIIDGSVNSVLKLSATKKTYTLASNLTDTIHEIEIFKRTEEPFGKTTFYGFVVDEGTALVDITNKRDKFIEFIGNSITCGYGNEGTLKDTYGPETENHYMTYAAMTSRSFNARHMAVCYSGIGIYRNYGGPSEGNQDCMLNFYPRIFFYEPLPLYDFKQKPDLICIDLGTNDFSPPGGDSSKFVNSYLSFLDTLQTRYYEPDIICLLGPMLGEPDLSTVRNCLKKIVDISDKKRRGRVSFFEMSQQKGDLGIGIDYHPTVAQHRKNALELIDYIKNLKGWTVTSLPTVGITNIKNTVHLYPNPPYEGIINYHFENEINEGLAEIFDMTGKLMYKKKIMGNNGTINLQDKLKRNNAYLIKITVDNIIYKETFVY